MKLPRLAAATPITTPIAALSAALIATAMLSGCGYRVVHDTGVTARRFAQDSVTIDSLHQQLAFLRQQSHVDSLRLETELASARAALAAVPTPVPYPDSLLKARAAEIAGLKDQLAKTTSELDRIKRRLANPRG